MENKGRDDKGRFVKGNQEGFNSTEVAREMQLKSAQQRVENNLSKKRGAELVRAILELKVSDPEILAKMMKTGIAKDEISHELACTVRQVEKAIRKGDTKAYLAVMKMAGYDKTEINVNAKGAVIFLPKDEIEGIQELAKR
jgi:predicted transcriptional regulator